MREKERRNRKLGTRVTTRENLKGAKNRTIGNSNHTHTRTHTHRDRGEEQDALRLCAKDAIPVFTPCCGAGSAGEFRYHLGHDVTCHSVPRGALSEETATNLS